MTDYFNTPVPSISTDISPATSTVFSEPQNQLPVSKYMLNQEVQNAEILWALKCVYSHYSFNSCSEIGKLFARMFPDSETAKQFACGEKKMSYICRFGIAPYFERLLFKYLEKLEHVVLLFDESLNKTLQMKQMDIYVRFWHINLNEVHTRYLTSHYLGHSKSDDILSHFLQSVQEFNLSKIIQISMDGPSVNWAFYEKFQVEIEKTYGNSALNIGSCGLHILNNAFKKANNTSDWNISLLLSSLYWYFKDCPARRQDFEKLSTKEGKFPLKFVNHRWLENVPATERALEI